MGSAISRVFEITKAVDYSDDQIVSNWVDLPEPGLLTVIDPRSRVPQRVIGGKGSGRTHLMRYCSFEGQCTRAKNAGVSVLEQVRVEGYVGLYVRCEGLNAGRFSGKGQSAETWAAIFAYATDLWLADVALTVYSQLLPELLTAEGDERGCVERLWSLLTCDAKAEKPSSVCDFRKMLETARRRLDRIVDNAAITRDVQDVEIIASRGNLVFGIPEVFERSFSVLSGITVQLLVDEMENLTEGQQKYVNTLVREKRSPTSIKVGARTYGVRTDQTLSAGEALVEGSEFSVVELDRTLRDNSHYRSFCDSLVRRRLEIGGFVVEGEVGEMFSSPSSKDMFSQTTVRVSEKYPSSPQRPWFVTLASVLRGGLGCSDVEARSVVHALQCADAPVLEKLNILLFLRRAKHGGSPVESARDVGRLGQAFRVRRADSPEHKVAYGHHSLDLVAQVCREAKLGAFERGGLDTLRRLSSGVPRHLLLMIKFACQRAAFQGEQPFVEQAPLSVQAQWFGIRRASDWFFEYAVACDHDTQSARRGVVRMASLFRKMRYSPALLESSPSAFAVADDLATLDGEAFAAVEHAVRIGLLVAKPHGRRAKNAEMGLRLAYQVSPMLSARFDISSSYRGVVELSPDEVRAAFLAPDESSFARFIEARLKSPFGGIADGKLMQGDLFRR